jgi:hypothetical protein
MAFVKYFVATDKPKEDIRVFDFRPFLKIRRSNTLDVQDNSLSISKLKDIVNGNLAMQLDMHPECILDILSGYNLCNTNEIPNNLMRDIEGVILDYHAFKKKDLIKNFCYFWDRLNSARRFPQICHAIGIINDDDSDLQDDIKKLLAGSNRLFFRSVNDSQLESNMMASCVGYCSSFVRSLSPSLGGVGEIFSGRSISLSDILLVLFNTPLKIQQKLDLSKLYSSNTNEVDGFNLNISETRKIFSMGHEFGNWFKESLVDRLIKNKDHHRVGLDPYIGAELITPHRRSVILSMIDSQFDGYFRKWDLVNNIIEELQDDFSERHMAVNNTVLRSEMMNLIGNCQAEDDASMEAMAKNILEGKILVNYQRSHIDKEEEDRLSCLGLSTDRNTTIFENNAGNFSKLRQVESLIDMYQFHNVGGKMDLSNLWKK